MCHLIIDHTSMPLTQAHVDKLKKIVETQSGETISNEEAWEMAYCLLDLYRLLIEAQSRRQPK